MPTLTVRLPCTLHARPASSLVLLASRYESDVVLRQGDATASAKNALELLSLGVAAGESVALEASGPDADDALEAVRRLIESCFREDSLPEPATSAVLGIALGTAVILRASAELLSIDFGLIEGGESSGSGRAGAPGGRDPERDRVLRAFERAERDVRSLTESLPEREAELFAPELDVLIGMKELVLARTEAGDLPETAVSEAVPGDASDLVRDARDRVLDALAGRSFQRRLRAALERARTQASPEASAPSGTEAAPDLEGISAIVLVCEGDLTPTLVAILPDEVVGIVATGETPGDGLTGHATILARGRGLPIVYVPRRVTKTVRNGDRLLLDAASDPARLWIAPSETIVAEATARRAQSHATTPESGLSVAHLGICLRVNVGSLREQLPHGIDGVGLLRTELLFAGRRSAPSEAEQLATILSLARSAGRGPIVVRLFDGGGDKPIPWLGRGPFRGIELLLRSPEVLAAQLRALGRAREQADVRALVPVVRSEADMAAVRAVAPRGLPLAAMIETKGAVDAVDSIASASESLSIGTNDLASDALGIPRSEAALTLDPRLLRLVARTIASGRARRTEVSVCGEIAGTERGAIVLVGLGADALSVGPARVVPVSMALGGVSREDCLRAAASALGS